MSNFNNERGVTSKWEICPSCCGDGVSSAYIGPMSTFTLDNEFSPDEREAYFRGDYDKECGRCNGTGKVLIRNIEDNESDYGYATGQEYFRNPLQWNK